MSGKNTPHMAIIRDMEVDFILIPRLEHVIIK